MLIALPNDRNQTRVAVSASRSLGNAVARNRAKRRIRAVLQNLSMSLISGYDLVIIARRPLHEASHQELFHAISSKLLEAHLLKNNHDDRYQSQH